MMRLKNISNKSDRRIDLLFNGIGNNYLGGQQNHKVHFRTGFLLPELVILVSAVFRAFALEYFQPGKGRPVRKYFSAQSDCNNCPLRKTCISDKAKTKKIQHSIYRPELEKAKARQQSVKGKVMKRKRSSTVEPVWGTLINFMGMKRINARGLAAAAPVCVRSGGRLGVAPRTDTLAVGAN